MPKKPCAAAGCHVLVEAGTPRCPRHAIAEQEQRWQAADAQRAERPSRKWYGMRAWRRRSQEQRRREPLCRLCPEDSKRPAEVADHIEPHRDDYAMFWFGPLQSLCKACHDIVKQREERRATPRGGPKVASEPSRDRRVP